jgi:predicted Ser/Thr protein kinase
MEIDTKQLKLKIGEYVGEFYNKPETLKTFNHPFLKSLVDMLTNEIKNSMILEEIKDLNSLMIKGNSNNGLACLKQPIKVHNILGEGAYGKVYRINNKKAAKIVALGAHFIWDEINKVKENILNEFAICKLAGELGVGPKVYDHYSCCDEQNQCYYVLYMDLLNGTNLYDWFNDNPSIEEQQHVKQRLVEKLEILHKNNIIHNDLHRGNVFIVNKKNAKGKSKVEDVFIIDYGLATNFKRKMKQSITWESKAVDYLFASNSNEKKSNDIYNYVVTRLLDNNDIKIKF